MSIRAKLITSVIIQIILVAAVGAALALTLEATRRANDKNIRSTSINEAITELRFITFENLLNHNQRSLEQWDLKYNSLTRMLTPTPADSSAERQVLAVMSEQHQTVKSLFDRITTSYQKPLPGQDSSEQSHFQERLIGQLLVKQQAQIAESSKLADFSRTEILNQQVRSFWIVLGLIVLMFVVTASNGLIIMMGISSSLRSLQQGVAALAAGKLDYRIRGLRNDELGRLAGAFNTMAASLKQIDQVKTEFILMVSHQLRTPATAVKGFISLLLDGYVGRLSLSQAETAQSALDENERQLKLIDEMLVVAQAETGQMVLSKTPIDLGEIVDEVVTAHATILKERAQSVIVHRPKALPKPQADAEKIRIVIENILANASNYSPHHKRIEVTLRKTAGELVVEIADYGFGIAKKDQPKLFKKFSRLSNTGETRIEGAGLGLYLAQKIVALHKGKISLTSEAGHGSTFAIHLPLAPTNK